MFGCLSYLIWHERALRIISCSHRDVNRRFPNSPATHCTVDAAATEQVPEGCHYLQCQKKKGHRNAAGGHNDKLQED